MENEVESMLTCEAVVLPLHEDAYQSPLSSLK